MNTNKKCKTIQFQIHTIYTKSLLRYTTNQSGSLAVYFGFQRDDRHAIFSPKLMIVRTNLTQFMNQTNMSFRFFCRRSDIHCLDALATALPAELDTLFARANTCSDNFNTDVRHQRTNKEHTHKTSEHRKHTEEELGSMWVSSEW